MSTIMQFRDANIDLEEVITFEPMSDGPDDPNPALAAFLLWDKPEWYLANATLADIERTLKQPDAF